MGKITCNTFTFDSHIAAVSCKSSSSTIGSEQSVAARRPETADVLEKYQIQYVRKWSKKVPQIAVPLIMLLFLFLSGVDGLGLRDDYYGGTNYRHDTSHLDVFMALFMMCTIEIVVLKIMISDNLTSDVEETDVSLQQSAVFNRELAQI